MRGVAVTSAGASCGSCCTDLSEVSFLFDWQDDINSKLFLLQRKGISGGRLVSCFLSVEIVMQI